MSHFPIEWPGNKRKELGHILPHVPADCRTLVEPFAGSAAASVAHWLAADNPDGCRYVLGDVDPGLCAFMLALRAEGLAPFMDWTRERLTPEAFAAIDGADPDEDTPRAWFYRRKVRRGRFDPKRGSPKKWPTLEISRAQADGVRFFREGRVDVICSDWRPIAQAHAQDPYAAIFLDPPYFSAYNQEYYGRRMLSGTGDIRDGTRLFVEIAQLMRGAAATVMLSTNGLAILTELYGPWLREVYAHRYSFATKCRDGVFRGKQARHLIAVKEATRLPTDEELAAVLADLLPDTNEADADAGPVVGVGHVPGPGVGRPYAVLEEVRGNVDGLDGNVAVLGEPLPGGGLGPQVAGEVDGLEQNAGNRGADGDDSRHSSPG